MRSTKLASLGVVLSLTLVMAGCGDSHESITKEMLGCMTELNTILDGVKDAASAKAAAPKVERLAAKWQDVQNRSKKVGEPSQAEQKALLDKYGKQMEEQTQKLVGNAMRIQFNPSLSGPLEAAMKKLPDSM